MGTKKPRYYQLRKPNRIAKRNQGSYANRNRHGKATQTYQQHVDQRKLQSMHRLPNIKRMKVVGVGNNKANKNKQRKRRSNTRNNSTSIATINPTNDPTIDRISEAINDQIDDAIMDDVTTSIGASNNFELSEYKMDTESVYDNGYMDDEYILKYMAETNRPLKTCLLPIDDNDVSYIFGKKYMKYLRNIPNDKMIIFVRHHVIYLQLVVMEDLFITKSNCLSNN